MIDWDDPAVRAIIACRDGRQAWEMLVQNLTPFRRRDLDAASRGQAEARRPAVRDDPGASGGKSCNDAAAELRNDGGS